MEDTLPETNMGHVTAGRAVITDQASDMAAALGEFLREHKGGDVSVLDLRMMNTWTDFFIIATVSSNAHMDGLERHIMEFCHEKEIEILRKSRKPQTGDDEWRLIHLGWMVIHLMSRSLRDFYELERLWATIPASRQNRTPE
jgi:ribosome-associated protein